MLSVIIYAQILLLAIPYVAVALAALLISGICCGSVRPRSGGSCGG